MSLSLSCIINNVSWIVAKKLIVHNYLFIAKFVLIVLIALAWIQFIHISIDPSFSLGNPTFHRFPEQFWISAIIFLQKSQRSMTPPVIWGPSLKQLTSSTLAGDC